MVTKFKVGDHIISLGCFFEDTTIAIFKIKGFSGGQDYLVEAIRTGIRHHRRHTFAYVKGQETFLFIKSTNSEFKLITVPYNYNKLWNSLNEQYTPMLSLQKLL